MFALFSRGLSILLALTLTACASISPPPPAPASSVPQGARIGLLVTGMDSSGVHEHVGTTVFNNFSAARNLPWDLGTRARTSFGAALSAAGYIVVEFTPQDLNPAAATALVEVVNQRWQVKPSAAAQVNRLRSDLKLDAVVAVVGQPTLASMECTGGPCTPRMAPKSGLFTHSMLGLTNYYAVAAFTTTVVTLAVPANLSAYAPIAPAAATRVTPLRSMTEPKDFKAMTAAEFAPVTQAIDSHLQRIAIASAQALSQGAR